MQFSDLEDGRIQYPLNATEEMCVVDKAWCYLRGEGAVAQSWDHDGLTVVARAIDLDALKNACKYDMTAKPSPGVDECLEALRRLAGDYSLEPLVTLETEALTRRARKEPLSSHELLARVVLSMPRVSDDVPWPLTDLYQITHSGALVWYNTQTHVWADADPKSGNLVLGKIITSMLQRALVKYRIECRDEIGVDARIEPDELSWDIGCKPLQRRGGFLHHEQYHRI